MGFFSARICTMLPFGKIVNYSQLPNGSRRGRLYTRHVLEPHFIFNSPFSNYHTVILSDNLYYKYVSIVCGLEFLAH